MAKPRIKLSSAAISESAKSSEMHAAIRALTDDVAANLRALEPDYPVETRVFTTDRAHGVVSIAHAAGLAIQAKRGSVTKSAAQTGLDVNS